ncbi:hypothetical protein [Pseudonocardia aurantiaca]|uniref:Pecanex-like protein 1 n=1 Tax=Pseudonocardia aurantiaca TaxID=75290 RepID=A0ABW4FDI2_9PSEU
MSPETHPSSADAEPREAFVPRRGPFARKLLICAAALVVTVVPVACSSAYADQTAAQTDHSGHNGPQKLFPVGGVDLPGNGTNGGSGKSNDNNDNNSNDSDANAGGKSSDNGGDNKSNDNNGGDSGNSGSGPDQAAADKKAGNNNGGGGGGGKADNNGLDVLGRDCSNSKLPPHNGFQEAPRCVETEFGEVASEDKSPSLLITKSPDTVKAGETFTLSVSTRNLVRDRFLGAAAGGYYLESSFLNKDGIQRGHFHTACRMLDSLDTAPDAAPDPEFFVATQDNGGGAAPDTVTVTVTGMPRAGTAQCAVWAGDGSHRVPMMQRANQTPAFDVVRVTVK